MPSLCSPYSVHLSGYRSESYAYTEGAAYGVGQVSLVYDTFIDTLPRISQEALRLPGLRLQI